MKFLSGKNVALMKKDVEGYEGKVIKGGIEIISKYHIPFIMFEFSQRLLKLHKTNILEFLKFFENNGYKFILIVIFFQTNYLFLLIKLVKKITEDAVAIKDIAKREYIYEEPNYEKP